MNLIEGVLLGIIQGISEFLPISSSGHLALFGNLILPETHSMDLLTEVILHLGTLIAVLIVFAREAFPVFLSPLSSIRVWRQKGFEGLKSHEPLRLLGLILLASIPAGLVGLIFHDEIESLVGEPGIVAGLLALTGLVLLASRWVARSARLRPQPRVSDAIIIGLAQASAVFPGISRSGMTISSGLMRGVSREMAGVFSFLLFIPAIIGASLLEVLKLVKASALNPLKAGVIECFIMPNFIPAYHLAGFISSLVFGFIALKFLLRLLKSGKFHWFGWYCLLATLVWTLAL